MSLGTLARQAKQCLQKQADYKHLNAFIPGRADTESILRHSQDADKRQDKRVPLSAIDGRLIAIKDNICTLEQPTTCGSAILQGFHSPFAATVVEKLGAAGAIVAGKTNLDEFGMGSHSVNSVYGPVRSLWSDTDSPRTVGGSSGGSALAVATGQCFAALGTDTGGSVRLPAAWTGTVGFKPSYGMVSRHGVVAYANSLDTVGIIARSIKSTKQVYDAVNSHDPRDPTSLSQPTRSRILQKLASLPPREHLRVGVPLEYLPSDLLPQIRTQWSLALQLLKDRGHSIHHISLPTTKAALSAYYVLAPAEASSNLAKYDGVRYGSKATSPSSSSGGRRTEGNVLFSPTRGQNLGPEVRRRILLGSYTLSSAAIDNYFIRAQKVRRLVQEDFNHVFAATHPLLPVTVRPQVKEETPAVEVVDVIVTPTALTYAPLISELEERNKKDPARQFYEDLYTVPASLAGLPAVSVPAPGVEEGGEKCGIQIMGQFGDDELVLRVGGMLMGAKEAEEEKE
ncbi:MAG: hypothetical protein Q9220_007318 [cf. Caloplaca sp. 1 TL-2023]